MISVDARELSSREMDEYVVYFNGAAYKGSNIVSADESTGLLELFKDVENFPGVPRLVNARVYPPQLGESEHRGRITQYLYGFVQIVRLRKKPEKN